MLQPVKKNINDQTRRKRKRSSLSENIPSTSKRKRQTASQQSMGSIISDQEPDFEFISCGGNLYSFLEVEFEAEKHERNLAKPWFSFQTNIRETFRKRLFEWLFQIHLKYGLEPYTLFLSASLFDRYMGKDKVERKKLQLVGSTCLWMASKYHDIQPLSARQLAKLAGKAFEDHECIKMEQKICKTLDFNLTVPCPLVFLSRFLIELRREEQFVHIKKCCMFTLEFILLEWTYVGKKPSWQATLALYFTLMSFKKRFSKSWKEFCGYEAKEMEIEAKKLYRKILDQSPSAKLEKKYVSVCKRLRATRMMLTFS